MKELEELFTLSEASKLLKVHPNTLRLWDRKGLLKAVRFGLRGDRRYKKDDLYELVNEKKGNV